MSINISVGDTVSWQERTVTRPYLHTVTGVVTQGGVEYVEVRCDYGYDVVPIAWLTRVGPIEAVADPDDYSLQMRLAGAGDLSGAELS